MHQHAQRNTLCSGHDASRRLLLTGGRHYNSEDFNTAGRSIKTGLIAVDIVSHVGSLPPPGSADVVHVPCQRPACSNQHCCAPQWTWLATLLQSSLEVYSAGSSGSLWYASGGTVQILLFGVMAIEIKRKAPRAHTVLELVRKRWGNTANWVRVLQRYPHFPSHILLTLSS